MGPFTVFCGRHTAPAVSVSLCLWSAIPPSTLRHAPVCSQQYWSKGCRLCLHGIGFLSLKWFLPSASSAPTTQQWQLDWHCGCKLWAFRLCTRPGWQNKTGAIRVDGAFFRRCSDNQLCCVFTGTHSFKITKQVFVRVKCSVTKRLSWELLGWVLRFTVGAIRGSTGCTIWRRGDWSGEDKRPFWGGGEVGEQGWNVSWGHNVQPPVQECAMLGVTGTGPRRRAWWWQCASFVGPWCWPLSASAVCCAYAIWASPLPPICGVCQSNGTPASSLLLISHCAHLWGQGFCVAVGKHNNPNHVIII